jgi:hypothetical protein
MNSRERCLSAIENKPVDYVPCSFMLFFNLYNTYKSELEYITREVELGLDPQVHVGHLNHTMHLTGTLHPRGKIFGMDRAERRGKVFLSPDRYPQRSAHQPHSAVGGLADRRGFPNL